MQYRLNVKNGEKLSALGFGFMRLPHIGKEIDVEESIRLVKLAYDNGVNYYDTAYVYYNGKSEEVLGQALKQLGIRENIKLATKLPLLTIKGYDDFDRLFVTSLSRLQTSYIDYYLIHCILDYDQYMRMVSYGLNDWIDIQKKTGKIKNIGFSFHGRRQDFIKIIDSYDWDFCQIQYNYVDINFQAGRIGLKHATEKNIPVIIMEPLRGGSLVNKVPEKAINEFKIINKDRTLADWGLRWLFNQSECIVTLSGMGNENMLMTNIATASQSLPNQLSHDENDVYERVTEILADNDKIGCTGCGYCLPCPRNVDIPTCFTAYNSRKFVGFVQSKVDYITTSGGLTERAGHASLCVNCGKCKRHCPQNIDIPTQLKKVAKKMEFPFYECVLKIVKKVRKV